MDISSDRVYMDHAGTTSMDKRVLAVMEPYFVQIFGNGSSIHSIGQEARRAVDDAREKIAQILGSRPREVIFTSGGTESDNTAIKGVAYALRSTGNHIITSSIEHHAVLHTCQHLEDNGFNIVIYANHMLRASYPAMRKVALEILKNSRSKEANKYLHPIKDILNLIPGMN